MNGFLESRGRPSRVGEGDTELMRSRMVLRSPRSPEPGAPETPPSPFALPALPWAGNQQLLGKPLTQREIEVLETIRDGATNKQTAFALQMSEQTAKNHMSSILAKLGVPDRTAAVIRAGQRGLLSLSLPVAGMPIPALLEVERRLVDVSTLVARLLEEVRSAHAAAMQPSPIRPASTCSIDGCDEARAPYAGRGRPPTKCEGHRRVAA